MTRPCGVTIVVATRNRRQLLLQTLARLLALPEQPRVVVLDNASTDGTSQALAAFHPQVRAVRLERNVGGAARTIGAALATTSLVAFSDDDSWWEPGALREAGKAFARHPRLGLLAARVLVGDDRVPDPICEALAAAPLGHPRDLPGPAVLGFLACGAVVRRDAFLAAGGFEPRYLVGGEEELLALDLAALGWGLAYVDTVVARHTPSPSRDVPERQRRQARNAVWTALLRRPLGVVAARLLTSGWHDPAARAGAADAARASRWALTRRRLAPPHVEALARILTA